jgi:catalase
VALLARDAAAKDFATDAFAHCKFIGCSAEALFEKTGLAAQLDEGCIALAEGKHAKAFVEALAGLRHWPRELNVTLTRPPSAPLVMMRQPR